jgi:hypothetical protein
MLSHLAALLVCVCSTEGSKKKPPIYKVMLHNDNYNRREYVVKILLKTVEGLTVDDAVNVMQVRARAWCWPRHLAPVVERQRVQPSPTRTPAAAAEH